MGEGWSRGTVVSWRNNPMALPISPQPAAKSAVQVAAKVSLKECFADLKDPRREHARRHNLWDIIAMTICGVISGADSWVDVEDYATCKRDFLESFLELPNGVPSHDTIGRVFARIDPDAFS